MKSCNVLDLKNPFFRYTGQQPQPPPGNNHTSPSEAYWNQHDLTAGNNPIVLRQFFLLPFSYSFRYFHLCLVFTAIHHRLFSRRVVLIVSTCPLD